MVENIKDKQKGRLCEKYCECDKCNCDVCDISEEENYSQIEGEVINYS